MGGPPFRKGTTMITTATTTRFKHLGSLLGCFMILASLALLGAFEARASSFPVVDTGQDACYDHRGRQTACPSAGEALFGQDAQSSGREARYTGHGDGTVTDGVTGLMWQQTPAYGLSYDAAVAGASSASTGGHHDWRLPSIKELYSLIDFRGVTGRSAADSKPYLDTGVFEFRYGNEAAGDRFIDAQYCSSTRYVGTTMGGADTVFGVNFADGRIKGYPTVRPRRGAKTFHVRYVRGGSGYGVNDFQDHGDGTIIDRATGLTWARADSGFGMDWRSALAWVQELNAESFLGHDDWRLPNAKELQSLVDYRRAPAVTGSAAIDPLFEVTRLPDGTYPYFWTSTTHLDGPPDIRGQAAVYVAFGEARGYMRMPPHRGSYRLLDVHGAGAQRSDPKTGDAGRFPRGRGPQGDVIRIDNFVRPVRDADVGGPPLALEETPIEGGLSR